jgi:hypothetical protein
LVLEISGDKGASPHDGGIGSWLYLAAVDVRTAMREGEEVVQV